MPCWRILFVIAVVCIFGSAPGFAQTDVTQTHPMIDAAAIGNADVVSSWLQRGTRVDSSDDEGRTALIYGAFTGSIDVVELTLEYGALIDRQDKHGNSALVWAANQGEFEIVERLIEAKANVNLQNLESQYYYQTQ